MRLAPIAAVLALVLTDSVCAETIAVHCPRLIDTDAGKLLGETTIVIEGARIKELRSGHADVAGAREIELKDQTCLPGLIDSHVHLTEQTSPTRYSDDFRWNPADYAIRSVVYART